MATQNEYNHMMWMNSNEIMMGESVHTSMSSNEILSLNQSPQMDNTYFSMPIPPPFESVTQQPLELDGFLMMDELEGEYDEPPQFLAAATQTQSNLRRKISPVKHPGLKLQTPIAFKCDTDPNVIPIQKDGMAICVKCGAIGVKHAFYTRNRNYCSLACARGVGDTHIHKEERDENDAPCGEIEFKYPSNFVIKDEELISKSVMTLPALKHGMPPVASFNNGSHIASFPLPNIELMDEQIPAPAFGKAKYELSLSYDWKAKLNTPGFSAASVNCFKHAPMSDCWEDIIVGMKVEVEKGSVSREGKDSFWVATVLCIQGYMAQLRYDGCDETHDFWVNLCNSNVHAVGWCAMRGKPLIPPTSIGDKRRDWKNFLVRSLTGARTLPMTFSLKIVENLRSRFRVGMQLEVIDKSRIGQLSVATIKRIVGKRLYMLYVNSSHDESGFWCHEDSPLIHPVGWSMRVGHFIDAPESYLDRCESGVMEKDDASEELFTAPFQSVSDWKIPECDNFQEGMKLEAIDPLNLSAISAATVMKVLQDGYLMIRIDSYPEDGDGYDWFCYHSRSPCIFPAGFCHKNNIRLVPPSKNSTETFTWDELVKTTGCELAPPSLFLKDEVNHGLTAGLSVECADLMDPRLVCVASITQVIGRLLKIHFDGWEEDYDQWMDCCSPDIYPVGWCHLVSHKLEAPKHQLKPGEAAEKKKKKLGRKPKKKHQVKAPANKKESHLQDGDETAAYNSCATERDTTQTDASSVTQLHDSSSQEKISDSEIDNETLMEVDVIAADKSPPHVSERYIPRLADGVKDGDLNPSQWTSQDVATFLTVNDCGVYANNFLNQDTSGARLLTMTQDEIMQVTGKMGPALKIYAIIQQLNQQIKFRANKFVRR